MNRRNFLQALALAPLVRFAPAVAAPAATTATNFATLSPAARKAWSADLWSQAREHSYVSRFHGSGANAIIQGL